MANRIRNGWTLAKQSFHVLLLDKELIVFPLLSGISCLLLLAGFGARAWASGLTAPENAANDGFSWVILFAWYFANYFVIVFFNAALVSCALIRSRGGDPKVSDGLRAASDRVSQIAAWALLAATVGVMLNMIESRLEFVGRIVTRLLGAAWTIGTYFVVPVLVVEKIGPFDAFVRSVAILRKAWGEAIVGNVGIGLVTFLVTLALVVITGAAATALAIATGSVTVALTGLAAMLVIVLLAVLVGSALNAIVVSAIYLFGTEGKVPEAFAGARLQEAFVAR